MESCNEDIARTLYYEDRTIDRFGFVQEEFKYKYTSHITIPIPEDEYKEVYRRVFRRKIGEFLTEKSVQLVESLTRFYNKLSITSCERLILEQHSSQEGFKILHIIAWLDEFVHNPEEGYDNLENSVLLEELLDTSRVINTDLTTLTEIKTTDQFYHAIKPLLYTTDTIRQWYNNSWCFYSWSKI